MAKSVGRRATAEFVGAFTLVFAGMGAIAIGADLVGVALAHGLAIAVMVSAVGHISGGHFNPAVTFGFLVTGRIAPRLATAYWAAQLAGAAAAGLLLRGAFSPDDQLDGGVPVLVEGVGAGSGPCWRACSRSSSSGSSSRRPPTRGARSSRSRGSRSA